MRPRGDAEKRAPFEKAALPASSSLALSVTSPRLCSATMPFSMRSLATVAALAGLASAHLDINYPTVRSSSSLSLLSSPSPS